MNDTPKRGDVLSADWLNELARKVDGFGRLRVAGPLSLRDGPGGPLIGMPATGGSRGSFYAQLMSVSGTAYGWREVDLGSDDVWQPVPGGRTGTPLAGAAFEYNLAMDVPVGSNGGTIVELLPGRGGVDYYFVYNRFGTKSDPLPCKGQLCIGAVCVCPGSLGTPPTIPPGSVTITVTDSNGAIVGSGTLGANGLFCCQPPAAGTYTITGTQTACPNFASSGTTTVKYSCTGGYAGVTFPSIADTQWPSSTYVNNPCCNCCPPCTTRPANKVPRSLHATFTGPFGVFGNYAGMPIALTLTGDSGNPIECAPAGGPALHWTSGCLGGNSAWGACYYSGFCGNPRLRNGAMICELTRMGKRVPGSKLFYQSASIDLYVQWDVFGGCTVSISYANFFGAGCTDFNVANPCVPNFQVRMYYPVEELPCPCIFGGVADEANPYIRQVFPEFVNATLPNLCAPVNVSLSNLPLIDFNTGFQQIVDSGGTPITWGVTVTE